MIVPPGGGATRYAITPEPTLYDRVLDNKRYEYKDHVGNVRVVSNDIKSRAVFTVSFTIKICNFANYYPFGMQNTGTADSYNLSSDYRYGYNGKEKDNEIKGEANSLDFGARIYDSRVGRWMSTDSLESKYPSMSAYNYVANAPRMAIDPDGKRRHSCLRALRETLRTVIISLQMGLIKQSQYGSAHNEKVKVLF